MDGFAHDQRLRLYTNCKFGILHRFLSKVAEILEQEGTFYVLQRTRLPLAEGYPAGLNTLKFDWSVVDGLNWMPYTWETVEIHLIDTHKNVYRKIRYEVVSVHKHLMVRTVSERFTCTDAGAAYRFYRGSPELVTSSRQSPAAPPRRPT